MSARRSGYVAIVGRPNVGKSTLLNVVVGTKIAATTRKPQTTRKNLLGIVERGDAELLFLDTPGYHRAKGPLNRLMVGEAKAAIRDADVIAYLVEARPDAKITPGNEPLLDMLRRQTKPVVLVVNKIDTVKDKEALLFQLQAYQEALGERLSAAVPISAMNLSGVERLLDELARQIPEGEAAYEPGQITDKSEREICAELIREKVILETSDELPYAVHVEIDRFEDERPKIVRIHATLSVERESQKPILIGKRGARLKAIGTRAREELERFLDAKVFLETHVDVRAGWTSSPRALLELGYSERDREDGPVLLADREELDGEEDLDDDEDEGA